MSVVTSRIWHTSLKRLDVNNDTHIAANDVLDVINYTTAFTAGPLPVRATYASPFLDVNGDNNVAPNDALDVINAINAGQGGEGEGLGSGVASQESVAGDLLALLAYDLLLQSQRKRQ